MRKDVKDAVLKMYANIDAARERQEALGHDDQGNRRGITSGKHFTPLERLIRNDLVDIGFDPDDIYYEDKENGLNRNTNCTLPGWYRRSKDWDLLAFDGDRLVTAIELKSISSSFGNNFNNRAEESIGSAVDAMESFNDGLYGQRIIPPAMGYVMVVRDCEKSNRFGKQAATHYPIDPVFDSTSYLDRFRILCERMRAKSLYTAVWFVTANPDVGIVAEPSPELTYEKFLATIEMALRVERA